MELLKRIIYISRGNHGTMAAASVFSALDVLLDLVPYFVVYNLVVVSVAGKISYSVVAWYSTAMLAALVLRSLCRWMAAVFAHKAGYMTLYKLRSDIAQHLGKLPGMYFSRQSTGNVQKIMIEDVERIENLLCHSLPDLCASMAAPLFTLCVFFYVDWRLAIFALIPFPLAIFCQRKLSDQARIYMPGFHNAMSDMGNSIMEYTRGIVLIKAFNLTAGSFGRLSSSVYAVRDVMTLWNKKASTYYALFGALLGSGLIFILPPGLWLFVKGTMSFQDLFLFMLLVAGYALPLDRLSRFASKLRQIEEGLCRIDELLATSPLPNPRAAFEPKGSWIEFDHVHFGYDSGKKLFSDLSFTLPEGSLTAFVGPSGAGKSTAAMLIARLQDVWEGAVRIGGVDVRDMPPEQIMNNISFVFQDTFIMSESVRDNIRAARPGASDAEVEDVAKMAKAHEFIVKLPHGYETQVGEGGLSLSGGERQRIAIARAMLRNAPVLILDEATAYTDPENEVAIQGALSGLLQGKTVIVIAHRLSTISKADRIIVFQEGTISGQGKHEALLAGNATYARLWNAQQLSENWVLNTVEA